MLRLVFAAALSFCAAGAALAWYPKTESLPGHEDFTACAGENLNYAAPATRATIEACTAYLSKRGKNDFHRAVAYYTRAEAYERGYLELALFDYGEAMRLDPKSRYDWLLKRADIFRAMGKMEAALIDLDESIRGVPTNPVSYALRADVALEIGTLPGGDCRLHRSHQAGFADRSE